MNLREKRERNGIARNEAMNYIRKLICDSEYIALAELRYRIRQFLRGSDDAAEAAGLEPQQYQMLLAIRGISDAVNIGRLAERLALRHHSAVGLIDRLEAHGYVRRARSGRDQRQVSVVLLPRGRRVLEKVVHQRLHELRGSGRALVATIRAIVHGNRPKSLKGKVWNGRDRARKSRSNASRQSKLARAA
jgi:DNA-binding MarR family transcriptional regulator